jgi:hypothetical protein
MIQHFTDFFYKLRPSTHALEEGELCPICLDDLSLSHKEGSSVQETECGHLFHKACITQHLLYAPQSKSKCPYCRSSLWRKNK